jgi:hypothetical protein
MNDVWQPVPPMTEIHELQLTVAKLGAALQDHQNKIEYLESRNIEISDHLVYLTNANDNVEEDMNREFKILKTNRMAYVHKRTRWWMRWIYTK